MTKNDVKNAELFSFIIISLGSVAVGVGAGSWLIGIGLALALWAAAGMVIVTIHAATYDVITEIRNMRDGLG